MFITNAVTIAFAAALVFFLQGFIPERRAREQGIPHTLFSSASLKFILLVPLSFYSFKFFNEANQNRLINDVVTAQILQLPGAQLVELDVQHVQGQLDMVITIRTNSPLCYEQVTDLQKSIATGLQQPVSLEVNQVLAEQFDPLVPPTETPTLVSTPMMTQIPSLTPTVEPTATPTYTSTATPTSTPTPGMVQVAVTKAPSLNLYQTPNGPTIGWIPGFLLNSVTDTLSP